MTEKLNFNSYTEATGGVAFREHRSLTTRSEKVIWLFFAATSIQLAFLQPYIILVPGEHSNLFSALLCFLSLIVALISMGRGSIRFSSPEFLVSVVLVALGVASALNSLPLKSPSFRVTVLLEACRGVDVPEGNVERAVSAMRDRGVRILSGVSFPEFVPQ